ncbi:coproporphyrinogen-III oxidase family protein [Archangium lipolyticum]|uniref:coproporphyrinogen-III oxidase family protein n=1 Tax=Archangium lipolyticum TaxID=2970465 RepID=UPI00214A4A4E|nr:radical SAM protein [Archangium lipolyticum]
MRKYYLGPEASHEVPFKKLLAISHYIMPNFATMDWDRVSREQVDENLRSLRDPGGALNDELMMYIHVPYCQSFCHYCNFNKNHYPWQDEERLQRYTDYLLKEIDYYLSLPYVQARRFTAIYIGGGSPSTLPVSAVERLFGHLAKVVPGFDTIEKTFTGEPRTLRKPDLLKVIHDYGFDRVTFGIETLNPEIHKKIGRWDSPSDVDAVFEGLEKLGYKGDRCVDLMYDLPGQSLVGFQEELATLVAHYRPDEIDAFGTVYLPYRPLHKLILDGRVPQPGSIWQLLRMREHLYDYLLENGYHNTIAETYSRKPQRSMYQTAHCARQDIIGIGCAARGNIKDMVSINPDKVDVWMNNIDQYGASTQTLQSIGRGGVLDRIMVMFPRYKELSKELLARYSDVEHFEQVEDVLRSHIEVGCVEEQEDRYVVNKLGVIWHGNLQTDYMERSLNLQGKVLLKVISEKESHFDREDRFKVNKATRFIAKHIDKYPKLMK